MHRRSEWRQSLCAVLMWLLFFQDATAIDVFRTGAQVSPDVATPILGTAQVCPQGAISEPIGLSGAVERSLCRSPKTREAWENVKAAAAQVGMSEAAYLPTLNAESQYTREHSTTSVSDATGLNSAFTEGVNANVLSLAWVLYDFGNRSAQLDGSNAALEAAQAAQNEELQAVFAATAKDYFTLQAAVANVDAARRVESAAQLSLEAARARVEKGVAAITDQLQANTARAQATYERVKAESDYQTALGTLNVDMGESPDQPLRLKMADDASPNVDFVKAVHQLIDEAVKTHPSVKAAQSQWSMAEAKVRSIRAQGLPSLSADGQLSYSNQPVSASLGQPELPATTRQDYLGVKLSIPLFEGFGRGYQIRQAEAQAAAQQQSLLDTEQQVAIGVWSSYQTLQAGTENLSNTDAVLESAKAAFDASRHRYDSGVGNILEVLSSQSALALAEQQRIQAQADWRTARIQLAASLGQLGMWAIQ